MVMNIKKAGWPLIRKATPYQMQRWAFSVALDALLVVEKHAKLSKVERDWLEDFLIPTGKALWYTAARENAETTLAAMRKPVKRFAPLIEVMMCDDKLPGEMTDAALEVAQEAFDLVEGCCPADVYTEQPTRQIGMLAVIVEDDQNQFYGVPVATSLATQVEDLETEEPLIPNQEEEWTLEADDEHEA